MEQRNSSEEEEKKRKIVSKDDVIAKLKDDGDFDNLRLKIIHKLKANEELRNRIIYIIRKSAALNRAGAENMKPRQLSDAIFDEVRTEVMGNISDGLWEIIRSGDGMKNEIRETVHSVYDKLVEPQRNEIVKSSTGDVVLVQNEAVAADGSLPDGKPQEPPGFSMSVNRQKNYEAKGELQMPMHHRGTMEEQKEGSKHLEDMLEIDDVDPGVPPGFSKNIEHKQRYDDSDEDPEVPPGFG